MQAMLTDWSPALYALDLAGPWIRGRSNREAKQIILSIIVNEWLYIGGVRPYLSWGFDGIANPQIAFGYGTYGSLAVQLMLAVSRASNLAECSGCSQMYLRKGRIPQRGRRNFCPVCHANGVDAVVRKRIFREKLRHGHGSGRG